MELPDERMKMFLEEAESLIKVNRTTFREITLWINVRPMRPLHYDFIGSFWSW